MLPNEHYSEEAHLVRAHFTFCSISCPQPIVLLPSHFSLLRSSFVYFTQVLKLSDIAATTPTLRQISTPLSLDSIHIPHSIFFFFPVLVFCSNNKTPTGAWITLLLTRSRDSSLATPPLPAALRRAKSLRPSCRTRSSTLAWW